MACAIMLYKPCVQANLKCETAGVADKLFDYFGSMITLLVRAFATPSDRFTRPAAAHSTDGVYEKG
jgi:hypothetical protein